MLDIVIETKKCIKCEEVKPLDQYPIRGRKKDGSISYRGYCKKCNKKYINDLNRKRRLDPEYIEKERKFGREYKRKLRLDPEYVCKEKEYYGNWRHTTSGKASIKTRSHKIKAIRLGRPYSPNLHTEYIHIKERLNNRCAYCASYLTLELEHIEHIVPLSAGGTHTPDNIVCSCARCNLSKNARPMEEWYREQPFFSEERLQQIYAIRDYWNAVGFEVVYPTEEQIIEAHAVAEDVIETIQSMSRLQRDPEYIQQYILITY